MQFFGNRKSDKHCVGRYVTHELGFWRNYVTPFTLQENNKNLGKDIIMGN